MALRTSTQSGDWSDTATWGGSAAPGDTDRAIVAHDVIVDTDTTVGASGPVRAVTAPSINLSTGASPTNLSTGTRRYNYCFVDSNGVEGPPFWTDTNSATITNGSSQPRITLPANPTGVASKNLYLSDAGGAAGTTRLYATGITGTTVDLISADFMDGTLPYASATPIANNSAILISGGSLTVAEDVTLTTRGDIQSSNRVMTLELGASLLFDSSDAVAAVVYRWVYGTTTSQTSTKFVCEGTSAKRCYVGKVGGSGNGLFGRFVSGGSQPLQIRAEYTDFEDLGADGIGFGIDAMEMIPGSGQEVHFDHCTFTRCGRVITTSNTAANVNVTFCRWRDAIGTGANKYLLWMVDSGTPTGTRVVTDNDFYDRDYAVVFQNRDEGYTFDRNVFSVITYSTVVGTGSAGMASCSNNIRINRVDGSSNSMSLGSPGTLVEDCYCIWDTATEGRGWGLGLISSGTGGTITVDGLITEGTCANEDSDAFNVGGSPSAAVTLAITGMLVLPNSRGLMSGAITAHGGANLTIEVEHSTLMSSQGAGSATGDAAIYLGSGYAGHANFLNKCRSNLVWNKATPSADGWITWDATSTVDDVINVSQTDNNATFNCRDGTVYDTAGANGVTVRGYENFELTDQTIGDTDITLTGSDETTGGPKFVDSSRNLATFDSAYLGNTPTAWADATGYVVGDMVSAQSSGFYANAVINYRCVTAHTSNAANATNGKPGGTTATAYRTNWEFAGAYRIREAIIANTLITDASLGLTNANYVATLSAWVKAGFAVQEVALKDAGHDGVTIGAVEYFSGGGILPLVACDTQNIADMCDMRG